MRKGKNLIYFGLFFLLLHSLTIFINPRYTSIYSVICFSVMLVIFLIVNDDEKLVPSIKLVNGLSIFSLFIAPIAGIFLLSGLSNIKKEIKQKKPKKHEEKEEVLTKETKRIDFILKLGVCLVILSGIILSTSSFCEGYDIVKPICLFAGSGLFYALSQFFKTKIVIKKSEKIYYVLSLLFIIFGVVSLGYFKILGDFLSFDGAGGKLLVSLIAILTSFAFFNIADKYEMEPLKYISAILLLLSLFLFVNYFNLNNCLKVGILAVCSFLLYYSRHIFDEKLNTINNLFFIIILFVYSGLYFAVGIITPLWICIGILLMSMCIYKLNFHDEHRLILSLFFPAFTISYVYITLHHWLSNDVSYNLVTTIVLLLFNYIYLTKNNKIMSYSGLLASLVAIFINLSVGLFSNNMIMPIISCIVVYTYLSHVMYYTSREIIKRAYLFSKILVLLFISKELIMYVNEYTNYVIQNNTIWYLFFTFFGILTIIEKNLLENFKYTKIFYYIVLIGSMIISLLFMNDVSIIFNIIFMSLIVLYRYLNEVSEDKEYVINFSLILTLFIHLTNIFIRYSNIWVSSLIPLILLLVVYRYYNSDKITSNLSLILAYIPYRYLIEDIGLSTELTTMLQVLPLIFLVFVITRKLLVIKYKNAVVFEVIFLSIIFIEYISEQNVILGLFTGIVGLSMILFSNKKERFDSLFYVGCGVTILNIIIQLENYWSKIPLFVYLLVVGLFLIYYVTRKELNKGKISFKRNIAVIDDDIDETIPSNKYIMAFLFLIIICGSIVSRLQVNYSNSYKDYSFNRILREYKIDTDKIYYDKNDYTILYISDDYNFDLSDYAKAYKEYENPDVYLTPYITVTYVPEACLDIIRSGGNCELDDNINNNPFVFGGRAYKTLNDKNFYLEIENKLNYINIEQKKDFYVINYNIFDQNPLKLTFSNLDKGYVHVYSDSESKFVSDNNTIDMKSEDGRIYIKYYKGAFENKDSNYQYYGEYNSGTSYWYNAN